LPYIPRSGNSLSRRFRVHQTEKTPEEWQNGLVSAASGGFFCYCFMSPFIPPDNLAPSGGIMSILANPVILCVTPLRSDPIQLSLWCTHSIPQYCHGYPIQTCMIPVWGGVKQKYLSTEHCSPLSIDGSGFLCYNKTMSPKNYPKRNRFFRYRTEGGRGLCIKVPLCGFRNGH